MFDQRLQILLSLEQRRRLEEEARRRKTSVARLVREAIDARLGIVAQAERAPAHREIRKMRALPFIVPREINRLVEEERDAVVGWVVLPDNE